MLCYCHAVGPWYRKARRKVSKTAAWRSPKTLAEPFIPSTLEPFPCFNRSLAYRFAIRCVPWDTVTIFAPFVAHRALSPPAYTERVATGEQFPADQRSTRLLCFGQRRNSNKMETRPPSAISEQSIQWTLDKSEYRKLAMPMTLCPIYTLSTRQKARARLLVLCLCVTCNFFGFICAFQRTRTRTSATATRILTPSESLFDIRPFRSWGSTRSAASTVSASVLFPISGYVKSSFTA